MKHPSLFQLSPDLSSAIPEDVERVLQQLEIELQMSIDGHIVDRIEDRLSRLEAFVLVSQQNQTNILRHLVNVSIDLGQG